MENLKDIFNQYKSIVLESVTQGIENVNQQDVMQRADDEILTPTMKKFIQSRNYIDEISKFPFWVKNCITDHKTYWFFKIPSPYKNNSDGCVYVAFRTVSAFVDLEYNGDFDLIPENLYYSDADYNWIIEFGIEGLLQDYRFDPYSCQKKANKKSNYYSAACFLNGYLEYCDNAGKWGNGGYYVDGDAGGNGYNAVDFQKEEIQFFEQKSKKLLEMLPEFCKEFQDEIFNPSENYSTWDLLEQGFISDYNQSAFSFKGTREWYERNYQSLDEDYE